MPDVFTDVGHLHVPQIFRTFVSQSYRDMRPTLVEIAPKSFYAVGIGVAINVLFSTMVNNLSILIKTSLNIN